MCYMGSQLNFLNLTHIYGFLFTLSCFGKMCSNYGISSDLISKKITHALNDIQTDLASHCFDFSAFQSICFVDQQELCCPKKQMQVCVKTEDTLSGFVMPVLVHKTHRNVLKNRDSVKLLIP